MRRAEFVRDFELLEPEDTELPPCKVKQSRASHAADTEYDRVECIVGHAAVSTLCEKQLELDLVFDRTPTDAEIRNLRLELPRFRNRTTMNGGELHSPV